MSDKDRRSEIPDLTDLYRDREPGLSEYDWSQMRRKGWLSASPSVPTVQDVERALAILAIMAKVEEDAEENGLWLN